MQWGEMIFIEHLNLSPMAQKQLGQRLVAIKGSIMKRGGTAVIFGLHVCAIIE